MRERFHAMPEAEHMHIPLGCAEDAPTLEEDF